MLDLSAITVVDNHCHSILRAPVHERDAFRLLFAESNSRAFTAFIPTMAYYRAAIIALGSELGVAPEEDAVLAARAGQPHEAWISRLLHAAGLHALLVDDGFPPGDGAYSREDLATLAGCPIGHVWRLEVAAQGLIPDHDNFDDLMTAWRAGLQNLRARGIISLKSIAAYRTGLQIAPADERGARAGFAELQEVGQRNGPIRLAHKALLEYLLHEALAAASEQGVPIQFHTGYGDPDTDLRLGNPLHLRVILEEPRYAGAPVILLHESYPYTREAAYLAAVYPHVYSDLSYAVPNVGLAELKAGTRAALAVAPADKLMYSSDGHSIPEHAWLGPGRARMTIAAVLDEMVAQGELQAYAAEETGAAILRDNARRVYRLDDAILAQPGNAAS